MKLSLKKYFIKSLFAMITVLSMSVVTSFALNNKAKVNLKPGQKTAMSGVVGTGKRAQYYCKNKSGVQLIVLANSYAAWVRYPYTKEASREISKGQSKTWKVTQRKDSHFKLQLICGYWEMCTAEGSVVMK